MATNLSPIEEKLAVGEPLDRSDARLLYQSRDLAQIAQWATAVRFRHDPEPIVTFLIDRNINYTNVCNTDCTFCAFYRPSSAHPESYVLTREELRSKIEETIAAGGTRILLQGGHNDDLPFDYYVDLVSWIHQNFAIEINAFSPSEIIQMTRVSGLAAESVLAELKDAGLAGLPGGGAELLDDQVRARVSPKKISADQWIEVMRIAHDLNLTTTATMVIGFGESIEARLNHFDRLRTLQSQTQAQGKQGFNAFISWILQFNENTSMGRSRHAAGYGASVLEYLKNLAIARIYLDNIPHHQSSWPTVGPAIAQLGLNFGCDDIGSTMMEENVVSQAGAPTKHKWSMSPEELIAHIREAGFIPAQRDSAFRILAQH